MIFFLSWTLEKHGAAARPDLSTRSQSQAFCGLEQGARKLAVVGLSYQGRWVLVSKRRTIFLHSCLPSGLWGTHEWISNMFIISHPSLRTYLKFMAFMAARRWQPKFYFSYEHANGFTVSTGSQASYQKIMFRRFLITLLTSSRCIETFENAMCMYNRLMRFFGSQRLENPLKVFYLFFILFEFSGISFFYPPSFWCFFVYPFFDHFFIMFLSSLFFVFFLFILFSSFVYPFFNILDFGVFLVYHFFNHFFIMVLSCFYPPSSKMDQNWLPQVQKAKSWGKV